VREAIQTLTATGQSAVSVSVDGVSITYAASQLMNLQERERELARRMTCRNSRKRVTPDFSGSGGADYLSQ
jgi:hypothetical protein